MPRSRQSRPPIRIITRTLAELQTSIMARALPMFDGSIDRFAIFCLLLGQALGAQGGEIRPISASATAASLNRPFETVRRHIRHLAAMGLADITPGGILLTAAAPTRAEVIALCHHAHDCLVRFVERLIVLSAVPPPVAAAHPYDPQTGIAAICEMMLAIAETNDGAHHGFADLVIFSSVLACNQRAITLSSAIGARIRDETHPMPPNLLRGARPTWIAEALGAPETTVRRRMQAMCGTQLVKVGNHYYVSEEWLNQPMSIAVSRESHSRVMRMLGRLAVAGFPFADVSTAYIGGVAPAYVDFG